MSIIHNVAHAHYHLDLLSVYNMVIYIIMWTTDYLTQFCWSTQYLEICVIQNYISCYDPFSVWCLLSSYLFKCTLHESNGVYANNKLIELEIGDSWYNYCLFQCMTSSNKSTITPNNYAINIIRTLTTQHQGCSFLYCHLNPKCEWLLGAEFLQNDSKIVNH